MEEVAGVGSRAWVERLALNSISASSLSHRGRKAEMVVVGGIQGIEGIGERNAVEKFQSNNMESMDAGARKKQRIFLVEVRRTSLQEATIDEVVKFR